MFDDGLDRRKAGATGDEHDRLVAFLAQKERAMRRFEAQDVAFLHLLEHMVGEAAAGYMPDMQLNEFIIMWRIGHGETAAGAIAQQEIQILTGQKLQPLGGRQLQSQHDDIVGQAFQLMHPRRQCFHLNVTGLAHLACFDHHIRQATRLAEQHRTIGFFALGQSLFGAVAVIHAAFNQLPFAGATGAIAAAIGQHQSGVERGGKNGFVSGSRELMAGVANLYLMGHVVLEKKKRKRCWGLESVCLVRVCCNRPMKFD